MSDKIETGNYLEALFTIGISHMFMSISLDCVGMPSQHISREVIKYAALAFGSMIILDFGDTSHIRTDERDKIDLLCSKGYSGSLNSYQEKTLDRICNNYEHNSMHDLEMLCAIIGDNTHLCADLN